MVQVALGLIKKNRRLNFLRSSLYKFAKELKSYSLTWPRPFPSHCKQGVNKRRKDEWIGLSLQTLPHVTVPRNERADQRASGEMDPKWRLRLHTWVIGWDGGSPTPGCAHPFTLCGHSRCPPPYPREINTPPQKNKSMDKLQRRIDEFSKRVFSFMI